MWAPSAGLDGELGSSPVTLGAELGVPAPGGPCLSKRDSSLNNSSQWEPSGCVRAHTSHDAPAHVNGYFLRYNVHPPNTHMPTYSRL